MKRQEKVFEEIIKREPLFHGKYLHLERLNVKLPDGRQGEREIVRVRDAVAVLPLDDGGKVHLVRQHRPAIERTLVEIPAGLLDIDESLSDAAVRECEEETGFRPGHLQELITYAHAEGYSTGFVTLFLGTELEYTGKTNLDATEFVEPADMPFDELLHMVRENRIYDSKTILGTLLTERLISTA
jgi:ADP-ribose pyrophosphatase